MTKLRSRIDAERRAFAGGSVPTRAAVGLRVKDYGV
jgi:hypothetical protein